jgi:hypothetical protein
MINNEHNPTANRDRNGESFTMRDHFAIIALTQIIASRPQETAEKIALEAYQIADSMIRQRNRRESGLKNSSKLPSRYAE